LDSSVRESFGEFSTRELAELGSREFVEYEKRELEEKERTVNGRGRNVKR